MRNGRRFLYGSALGAALGVVLAPRLGESRRMALTRLRLSLRPGGSLGAFAGTPCSQAGPTSAEAEQRPARDERSA
jgi:hypothetical protein